MFKMSDQLFANKLLGIILHHQFFSDYYLLSFIVYQAVIKEMAEHELEKLSEKWSNKYPVVIASRKRI